MGSRWVGIFRKHRLEMLVSAETSEHMAFDYAAICIYIYIRQETAVKKKNYY